MFNSPILDIAIGLVFIFLLYSLLATTVKEAIATLFALRASMLKKGIIEGMLTDTPAQSKLGSMVTGTWKIITGIFYTIRWTPKNRNACKKIGDKFYEHPVIKNYGSGGIFPLPSYIPGNNFSLVLIDLLKEDFSGKLNAIIEYKKSNGQSLVENQQIRNDLLLSNDAVKIKTLFDYYTSFHVKEETVPLGIIDKETCRILRMHLQNSFYDLGVFAQKLENWFDDSMNRVSGWYKRQVEMILFAIGLSMAIVFNVDTLQIAGKLTTDKDARDKMVALALKATEQYKDDPRVKPVTATDSPLSDSLKRLSNEAVFKTYQDKMDEAKKELNTNMANANSLLAIGWGDFGMRRDSARLLNVTYKNETDSLIKMYFADPSNHVSATHLDTMHARSFALAAYYNNRHWAVLKIGYVISESFRGKKFLGFLILAFAVCLGAPFWFDLLNRFIKLRGSGKKEDSSGSNANGLVQQPVTVNVNTHKPGEEAVG
jgi:hypothetical protein